jgi:hypothetical protein
VVTEKRQKTKKVQKTEGKGVGGKHPTARPRPPTIVLAFVVLVLCCFFVINLLLALKGVVVSLFSLFCTSILAYPVSFQQMLPFSHFCFLNLFINFPLSHLLPPTIRLLSSPKFSTATSGLVMYFFRF